MGTEQENYWQNIVHREKKKQNRKKKTKIEDDEEDQVPLNNPEYMMEDEENIDYSDSAQSNDSDDQP